MIFYGLEPFGTEVDLLGHAINAATTANVNRKKGKKAYTAEDFMPEFGKKKDQSVDEMINLAAVFTVASGGEDKR